MSWIQKELKRRELQQQRDEGLTLMAPMPTPTVLAADQVRALWVRLLDENAELPDALRLQPATPPPPDALGSPVIREWLKAPNGAGLGITHDALRYVWPKRSVNRSNNFWIRWHTPTNGFRIERRVGHGLPPVMDIYRFDEARLSDLLRGLVVCKQVTPRSLRKRRFWIF